jgi:hypothetical protein
VVGDHEAAGAIPVSQTHGRRRREARQLTANEPDRRGSRSSRASSSKTGCSSGAEHVADYDVVTGAIPVIRTSSFDLKPIRH